MTETHYFLPAGLTGDVRSGTIEPSTARDGTPDFWVELFDADGTLVRASALKTWRGADRVVQAWLKAGR